LKEIGLLLLNSGEINWNATFTCSRVVSEGFWEAVKNRLSGV